MGAGWRGSGCTWDNIRISDDARMINDNWMIEDDRMMTMLMVLSRPLAINRPAACRTMMTMLCLYLVYVRVTQMVGESLQLVRHQVVVPQTPVVAGTGGPRSPGWNGQVFTKNV